MDEPTGRLINTWAIIDGLRVLTRCSANSVPMPQPPVVLVHGLSVSSRYMVPTARQLAPYRDVFAPDLPGFGESERPAHLLNIPQLADALVRWMDTFGLERAALLGNSMGCQIIADLAVRYPQRLTHAIFTGPTMDSSARTVHQQGLRLFRDGLHEPLSSILTQASDYWRFGARRTIAMLRLALADRIELKLPHIHVPTLVVRGTQDTIAPQGWVEEVTRLLPHGQLVVMPHTPHAVNYDAPIRLARLVRAFLDTSAET